MLAKYNDVSKPFITHLFGGLVYCCKIKSLSNVCLKEEGVITKNFAPTTTPSNTLWDQRSVVGATDAAASKMRSSNGHVHVCIPKHCQ